MPTGGRPDITAADPTALSPLDGRYKAQLESYSHNFSEQALIRQRFRVEVEWIIALSQEPSILELEALDSETSATLRGWVEEFGSTEASDIKVIEAQTNHDVKAVEYHLKRRLSGLGWSAARREFVHFAATSEDVNNLAYGLMLKEGVAGVWLDEADRLCAEILDLAESCSAVPMLAHTHGQPASPTTLGKELAVFAYRLARQADQVRSLRLSGKFNGAVGTFGAHVAAYPEVDWIDVSRRFVEGFGLEWNPLTTQIEPHDTMAELFHAMVRFNTILVDFCRDMWEYVSRSYLRQRVLAGEVGSSTMPHKVNPIDFENAEANAGISSALLEHLASKLMTSRMQRDLSDSSALRNIGVAAGHSGLAVASARRGLTKVIPDAASMAEDLGRHWEVLAEAVQTVMRRYGVDEPYERLKELTRGRQVGPEALRAFVDSLDLPEEAAARLGALTPDGYTGLAGELVRFAVAKRGSNAPSDPDSNEPVHTPAW